MVHGNTLTIAGSYRKTTTTRPLADIDVIRMVRVDAVRHLVRARLDALSELNSIESELWPDEDAAPQSPLSWRDALVLAIEGLRTSPVAAKMPGRLDAVSAKAFAALFFELEAEERDSVVEQLKNEVSATHSTFEETPTILFEVLKRNLNSLVRGIQLLAFIAAVNCVLATICSSHAGLLRLREFVCSHRAFFLTHGAHPPRTRGLSGHSPVVAPV